MSLATPSKIGELQIKLYRKAKNECRAALKSRTGAHVFSTLSSNLIQLSLPLNRGLVYLNRGQTDRRTLSSI